MSVVCTLLPAVCCLYVVYCALCVRCDLLMCAVNCVCGLRPLLAVCCPWCAACCCLISVAASVCMLVVARWLLFVGCCVFVIAGGLLFELC